MCSTVLMGDQEGTFPWRPRKVFFSAVFSFEVIVGLCVGVKNTSPKKCADAVKFQWCTNVSGSLSNTFMEIVWRIPSGYGIMIACSSSISECHKSSCRNWLIGTEHSNIQAVGMLSYQITFRLTDVLWRSWNDSKYVAFWQLLIPNHSYQTTTGSTQKANKPGHINTMIGHTL